MSALRRAWQRCLAVLAPRRLDREFDDEAESHIALAADDYVQRGMPRGEAERLARRAFGSVAASKDAHRDARSLPSLEALIYDLRVAARGLRRDWTFTAAAIAMLAIAIGLNVTISVIADAMLFRGYPLVTRGDRLLHIQERARSGMSTFTLRYADFEQWRAQTHTFEEIAFVGERRISLRDGDGRPFDTLAWTISVNTFHLLGVAPARGRDFTPADGQSGAPPVAILSDRFWKARFGGRADIVGLAVHIDTVPATIVGVMPERFEFPLENDLWIPQPRPATLDRRDPVQRGFVAVGRLRDGSTKEEALADLQAVSRRLEQEFPETNANIAPDVATHAEFNNGKHVRTIWGSLWTAAWFVLLIACANLANLTLVRTMARWREFATRIALGAGVWRVVRQIVVENLMLSAAAGTLAWWLTEISLRAWMAVTASHFQVIDYTIDARAVVYLAAISCVAALLGSIAPVVRLMRLGAGGALKGDARGVTQSLRAKHLAASLVVAQMTLAIVLLAGTGVLARSVLKIVNADTGIRDPEHILVDHLRLPSELYASADKRKQYLDHVVNRLQTLPGVDDVALSSGVPVRFGGGALTFEIDGRPAPPEGLDVVGTSLIAPDYFRVLGVAPIAGRPFTSADQPSTLPVAIVNQSFAEHFWPGQQPVGRRIRAVTAGVPGAWKTIVGVTPNVREADALRQEFKPVVYLPLGQAPAPQRPYLLLRSSLPPAQLAGPVRAEIQRIDPDVTLEEFGALTALFGFDRDYMDVEHSELRKHAVVATIFGVIALLLAAIGLGAVMAHSVAQRTKEIGVRMAIGAAARDIRRMVLHEGLRPVAAGLIVGLAASLAVNRVLQSQLVGVSPYDPLTFTGAPIILVAVACLACLLPVRRAIRVEPAIALRHE